MDYDQKHDPAEFCWMHLKTLETCGCDYESYPQVYPQVVDNS